LKSGLHEYLIGIEKKLARIDKAIGKSFAFD